MKIMGLKFLNLHMIPWCFHFVGNHPDSCPFEQQPPTSSRPAAAVKNKKTIKVIKSDGIVKIYDRSINVSEVMVEYPKHLVCHSDTFYIGQKIPTLSDNDKLLLGHTYFLLPKPFFQSVLSFGTIASFAAAAAASGEQKNPHPKQSILMKKAAAANCKPFDIQKTASGCLRIRVSDEFISHLIMEEEEEVVGNKIICNTPELEKEYMHLVVGCRRHWKPKLESIREIDHKKKHKISSSFRIKKRSTTTSRNNKSQPPKSSTTTNIKSEHHHLVNLTSCAKVKPTTTTTKKMIKFRSR